MFVPSETRQPTDRNTTRFCATPRTAASGIEYVRGCLSQLFFNVAEIWTAEVFGLTACINFLNLNFPFVFARLGLFSTAADLHSGAGTSRRTKAEVSQPALFFFEDFLHTFLTDGT